MICLLGIDFEILHCNFILRDVITRSINFYYAKISFNQFNPNFNVRPLAFKNKKKCKHIRNELTRGRIKNTEPLRTIIYKLGEQHLTGNFFGRGQWKMPLALAILFYNICLESEIKERYNRHVFLTQRKSVG